MCWFEGVFCQLLGLASLNALGLASDARRHRPLILCPIRPSDTTAASARIHNVTNDQLCSDDAFPEQPNAYGATGHHGCDSLPSRTL